MCKVCTDASPKCCARFYPIWCMVTGFLFIMTIIYPLVEAVEMHVIVKPAKDKLSKHSTLHFFYTIPTVGIALLSIYMFLAVLYIIAGVLMLVGDFQDKALLFRIGKILSYFFPCASVLLIYPIVAHVFAVLKLSQYQKERWP